ncbi:MAG: FAD binding domain-containing protein [Candidatus Xenobiia bacterium LiM19]
MTLKEGYNPGTVDEALEILNKYQDKKVRIIAGGTDLMVFLKDGKADFNHLVDITGIKELQGVHEDGDRLVIGPLVTHAEAAVNPLIVKKAPVLMKGCAIMGSPQIRHRGTLGGNVCTGSPAGDSLPALAVLGAVFTLKSLSGERVVPFNEFFTGPQKTAARSDELLTAITIVPMKAKEHHFYERLGLRKALTVSKASVAAAAKIDGGTVKDIRIALGSVGPTVKRAELAENYLLNRALSEEVIAQTVKNVQKDATPIDDIRSTAAYRTHATGVLLERFLQSLIQ